MRVLISLCLIIAGTLLPLDASSDNTTAANGIVPLHSTRLDVEKRFGRSTDSCQCIFRTAKETIAIDYALARCKGRLYGWNVPKDTVLAFTLTPKVPIPVSEIILEPGRFVKTRSHDENVTVYYTSVEDGIKYAVQENHVIYVQRIPSRKDNLLRCAGFPPYDGGIAEYPPYDSFIRNNDVDTIARLDNFAVQLSQASSFTGYVIAYAGKVARKDEGRKMADWARRYLVEKRNISPKRVVVVDGGFRILPAYDFFLLPDTMRAPTVTPTVSSKEVRIVRR
jgi:hypothetical protein